MEGEGGSADDSRHQQSVMDDTALRYSVMKAGLNMLGNVPDYQYI